MNSRLCLPCLKFTPWSIHLICILGSYTGSIRLHPPGEKSCRSFVAPTPHNLPEERGHKQEMFLHQRHIYPSCIAVSQHKQGLDQIQAAVPVYETEYWLKRRNWVFSKGIFSHHVSGILVWCHSLKKEKWTVRSPVNVFGWTHSDKCSMERAQMSLVLTLKTKTNKHIF